MLIAPKLERVLEIGLGGGRTVSYLSAALPDTAILAVEIDKDVVDLAKKYFKFTETARLRAVVSDGRAFLMRDRETWDVIMIDAYRGPFVPFHLLTKEFYTLVKSRLTPGRGGGAEHRALDHAVRLARAPRSRACFPRSISMTAAATWSRSATTAPSLRASRTCSRAPPRRRSSYKLRYDLRTHGGRAAACSARPTGKIMTDDFAPVETLRAIEQNNEKWKEQTEAPR